jgi:hypothetical protein
MTLAANPLNRKEFEIFFDSPRHFVIIGAGYAHVSI